VQHADRWVNADDVSMSADGLRRDASGKSRPGANIEDAISWREAYRGNEIPGHGLDPWDGDVLVSFCHGVIRQPPGGAI
jgi:hypothetical protein